MPKKLSTPQMVTHHDPSRAYNGYTVFAPMGSIYVWLIDMAGNFLHRWRVPDLMGVHGRLLLNGNLLVGNRKPDSPVADMAASGGEVLELDWDNNIVWRYEEPYLNLHDYYRLPNGNTLVTVWVPIPDDTAAKVKGGRPGSERDGIMWSDCFREITPEGETVWEWKAYEHLDFDEDVICPLCSRSTWSYINSWAVLPNDDLVVCLRVLNTIAIVSKASGEIKWRWGMEEIGHQHNPTILGNGNILLFDNGLHAQSKAINPSRSRVIEINPNSGKIEWEYVDEDIMSFYSPICSGAQRLPNGNTLICESTKGRVIEVTPDKEIVWEFFSPLYYHYRPDFFGEYTNLIYRAYRYGPDYADLKHRELKPGKFEWVLQEVGRLSDAHQPEIKDISQERQKQVPY